jgi:predicted DNA-binding transcriptional regulator YafY
MRRAERLFEIIQILRRKKLTRARDLAEKLEVSERTIYRDIAALVGSGVPIEGEAGVGYLMRDGFDLPPLMFDEREIEALALGARVVETWTDPEMAEAAASAIAKIKAVIPERLGKHLAETAYIAPADHYAAPISFNPSILRKAVRQRAVVQLRYRDREERSTTRNVRPLALAFYGPVWHLASWCELRQDFRSFRLDRISELQVLEETFHLERGKTLHDFIKRECEKPL